MSRLEVLDDIIELLIKQVVEEIDSKETENNKAAS